MANAKRIADRSGSVHDVRGYIRDVERQCQVRGLRLTPLRAEVLQILATEGRPTRAYDLLDRIKATKAPSAPTTVYRTLDFLIANGFVHKLESINAFVACRHPALDHVAPFLICDTCDRAVEIDDEAAPTLLIKHAGDLGFVPRTQTLEVHGRCADCTAPTPTRKRKT